MPGTAELYRLDNDGSQAARLGIFRDDGLEGDEIASDLTFTTRVTIQESQETMIPVRASAAFRESSYIVYSLPAIVTVKPNVSLDGPHAVIDSEHVVFRNPQGQKILEIPIIHNTESTPDGNNTAITITEERPIASLDQRYVGILKTQIGSLVIPGEESENETQLAQEFRYVDASGTLWAKNPEGAGRSFYYPEHSQLISADGQRILLIEVSDGNNDPQLSVYNATGATILHEVLNLSAVTETMLSSNGRYVLLRGNPTTAQVDIQVITIIEIDNPTNRWSSSISGSTTTSEKFIENASGGFEVWINDAKLISFPN